MKKAGIATVAFIYTTLAIAGPDVIIPSKAIDHLFYLYKNYSINQEEVSVVGQNFTRTGPNALTHNKTGHQGKVSLKDFIYYRYLGASVFKAQTGGGGAVGTASLIGKNLVLTNQHVLDTTNDKKECGKFEVYLDEDDKVASTCKKVLYCDTQDFCVAEMNQVNGKDLSDIVRPISIKTTKETVAKKLYIVGNAYGLGIQGSSGKEYKYVKKNSVEYRKYFDEYTLVHHTPTLSGSSGSPIFNGSGEMIGINYANNSEKGYVDDNANNLAVPSDYLITQLKKNLPKEIFNTIKTDNPISSTTLKEYGDQFRITIDISSNLKLNDSLIENSIRSGSTAEIEKDIKDQTENVKRELDLFSERELAYQQTVNAHPVIAEIKKINSHLSDWRIEQAATAQCRAIKDLTKECRQSYVMQTLNSSKLFSKYSEQERIEIIQERIKFRETSVIDILEFIKDDKILAKNIFKKCLSSLSKFNLSGETVFYGDYSSIAYTNQSCQKIIISEIRATGLHWTAKMEGEAAMAQMIVANTDISKLENLFESEVARKWQFGLLGKSGTNSQKVEMNKSVLKIWLLKINEQNNLNEWFEIINPRIRKSIL